MEPVGNCSFGRFAGLIELGLEMGDIDEDVVIGVVCVDERSS